MLCFCQPPHLFQPLRLLTLEIFANLPVYYFGRNLLASPFIPPSPSIWNSRVSIYDMIYIIYMVIYTYMIYIYIYIYTVPWPVTVRLWAQFMTVVSLHQSHEKSTLGWQRENGSKGIITLKSSFIHKRYSHETTLSSNVWHLQETSDVTPNLKWSVEIVRCALLKHYKRASFVFIWKIGYHYLSKTTRSK